MPHDFTTYLKYAHLQIAAEAFYGLKNASAGAKNSSSAIPLHALTIGNERSSKFTATDAAWFAQMWEVVEHQSNTRTGFSGTLFRAKQSDDKWGITEGEQVLSFRSTEFVDDATRDNQATNTMEVKEHGWAFGQIDDMQKWFISLKNNEKLEAKNPIVVTGYSLGGHLATAFYLLHKDDLIAPGKPLIQKIYTFNGAGVGKVNSKIDLVDVMDIFSSVRNGTNSEQIKSHEGRALYEEWKKKTLISPSVDKIEDAIKFVETKHQQYLVTTNLKLRDYKITNDYELLTVALMRMKEIAIERDRVSLIKNNGGMDPLTTDAANIAALELDYQIAVWAASYHTASINSDPISGGIAAITKRAIWASRAFCSCQFAMALW